MTILKVAVNAPLSHLFDYLPGSGQDPGALRPGCRVLVPFRRSERPALVMETAAASDLSGSRLRPVIALLDDSPLLGDADLWLIRFTSDYYHHPIGEVAAAALPGLLRQGRSLYPLTERVSLTAAGDEVDPAKLEKRAPRQAELISALKDAPGLAAAELDEVVPGWRRVKKSLEAKALIQIRATRDEVESFRATGPRRAGPTLNGAQEQVVAVIREQRGYCAALLDGVTGSGKTEVYLRLIADVLDRGRQAMILVPEIGLTPQLLSRIESRLGVRPALLHSSLSDTARLAAWRAARDGEAALVLGTRSAVFTPLRRPGLIIVDEEHDGSLKQTEGLRYSARDLAVARARHLDIPVVLGSATPSLETLQRCRDKAYLHLNLPHRATRAAPPLIRLVDVSDERANDGVSDKVVRAMARSLDRRGQVLVFLNRRGFAPTLICGSCGGIAECSRCDARMTVHAAEQRLKCHHCGAARALDECCVDCGGPCRPLGHGTERLEETLRALFPANTIARIDSDSMRLKGSMDRALAMARKGETDILIGTQMLSKGHHFPDLSLVVVINADQGLFSSDFRGSERLAQSLVQVSGRAGRENVQGEVLIQTAFPKHPFWEELLKGGYERVAECTLEERRAAGWPPFSRLALIRASAGDRDTAHRFLDRAFKLADAANEGLVRILGPVSAPMERRRGRYRAQLLLQSVNRPALHHLLNILRPELEGTVEARRVRWSIDVDPIELF